MAKLSSIRGMQDARDKDMFHLSTSNYVRYNGHISSPPKSGGSSGGKKERRGCPRGKIEALKRRSWFTPVISPAQATMTVSAVTERPAPAPPPVDPYAFTDAEVIGPSSAVRSSSQTTPRPMQTVRLDSPSAIVSQSQPALSKMLKLQAEFARNKVMGKRRRVDSAASSTPSTTSPGPPSTPVRRTAPSRVLIPPSRALSTWQREKRARHQLLQSLQTAKADHDLLHQDIYPLGVELTESEGDSSSDIEQSNYCKEWVDGVSGWRREDRIAALRTQLRRKLRQAVRGVAVAEQPPSTRYTLAAIAAARSLPNATAALLRGSPAPAPSPTVSAQTCLVRGERCSHWQGCERQALPCARHCALHILASVDQRLFQRCSAKNPSTQTQCSAAVFDVIHAVPLCPTHAVSEPPTPTPPPAPVSNRRSSSSSLRFRNKKRRRPTNQSTSSPASLSPQRPDEVQLSRSMVELNANLDIEVSGAIGHTMTIHIPEPPQAQPPPIEVTPPPPPPQPQPPPTSLVEDGIVPDEVLAMAAALDPAELASQASKLLEEHDLNSVLNQISTDAFNDLFAEDKNGGYIEGGPTAEDEEELDRALEAVETDMRSLETAMTASFPSLDTFLAPFANTPALVPVTAAVPPPTGPPPPFQPS